MSATATVEIACHRGVLPNGIRRADACPNVFSTTKTASVEEARDAAHAAGWTTTVDDEDWCPAHAEARALARAIKPVVRALGWVNNPDVTDRSLSLRSLHSDDGVVGLVEAAVVYEHHSRGRCRATAQAETADSAIVRAVADAGGPPAVPVEGKP
jgi:hypothetical protein